MIIRELRFWYKPSPTWVAYLLLPFSLLFLAGGWLRTLFTATRRVPIPVMCVGNINVGGSGKTPTALTIARLLQDRGKTVHFLTRGYGGLHKGPIQVRPDLHTAEDVGDEACLLAQEAPTWVSSNRYLGAKRAYDAGADVIVMDDGFQNPTLYKDLSLVVVDGHRQLGNGLILPAGPLREPAFEAFARADGIILVGDGEFTALKPVFRGYIRPLPDSLAALKGPYLAFSGIGNPDKFFKTLKEAHIPLVDQRYFPDHHPFSPSEIYLLLEDARSKGATLLTTRKDWVRVPSSYQGKVECLDVEFEFQDTESFLNLVERHIR